MNNNEKTMEKIVSLCKGRGFIFAGSEIYGGLSNTWDYGPLGVELKNNVKRAWWKRFVQQSPYNVGLDSAILLPCGGAKLILVGRDAEQQNFVDARCQQLLDLLADAVRAVMVLVDQGGNLLLDAAAFADKDRVNQRGFAQAGFPRKLPDIFIDSQTSGSV